MTTWTIAYRKPRANHFKRVNNWSGSWHQARKVAALFMADNPGLQVWYVPSAEGERQEAARIAAGEISADLAEDHGNVMVDSGKRIKIRETGELPADMIAAIPSAGAAKAAWLNGSY